MLAVHGGHFRAVHLLPDHRASVAVGAYHDLCGLHVKIGGQERQRYGRVVRGGNLKDQAAAIHR